MSGAARRNLETNAMQTKLGWTVPFLAICLLGCGNYTVTFRVQDVINTGGRGDSYAKLLDVDPRTVDTDWQLAKAWLKRELSQEPQ